MRVRAVRLNEQRLDLDRRNNTLLALSWHVANAFVAAALFFACVAVALMVIQ